MRLWGSSCGRALLCLCLLAGLITVGAQNLGTEGESVTPSSPSRTSIDNGQTTTIPATASVSLEDISAGPSAAPSSSRSPTTPAAPSSTTESTATLFNFTIPEGQLPLEPVITPGWAVAGTILLGAGLVYALVGIRVTWLHTFFSTAFLAGLGTTVLILYLMTPPVGNAVQGAYVVAAVCTGAVFGGLAVVFQDLAECLGCLLGGFSLSMWLLTLGPGGLIPNISGKVAFIAVFTVAGFALYFSRWTRTYGLVVCISFSGATATVIGIDCFSRAGLREFWAYIWALNDRLFPLGAVTYPLTRGIRVELAITIILSVFGIVSQLKLWRLVKDRRNEGEGEPPEPERDMRSEEEDIGRQTEEIISRERREWERVYGDGTANALVGSTDSGVGGMEGEKELQDNGRTLVDSATRPESPAESPPDTVVPPQPLIETSGVQTIIAKDVGDGRVTVKVAEDDMPEGVTVEAAEKGNGQGENVSTSTARHSFQETVELPVVYPPFTIPVAKNDDDRSSAATFADEGDGFSNKAAAENGNDGTVRSAQTQDFRVDRLTKGWSTISGSPKGILSQHSMAHQGDDYNGIEERSEALAQPTRESRDDIDSILANLDDTSSDGDVNAIQEWKSLKAKKTSEETMIAEHERTAPFRDEPDDVIDDSLESPEQTVRISPEPFATHHATAPGPPPGNAERVMEIGNIAGDREENVSSPEQAQSSKTEEPGDAPVKPPESTVSGPSATASLTRENLPPAFSHVALAYRTNEWAKHLSVAETPEPDALQLHEYAELSSDAQEQPASLDIIDLQQTAENATPPPAAPRASSVLPNLALHHGMVRSNPRTSSYTEMGQPENKGIPHRPAPTMLQPTLLAETIAEEGDGAMPPPTEAAWMAQSMGTPSQTNPRLPMSTPAANSPGRPTPQHGRPQTLMGLREALLRNRASATFARPEANGPYIAPEASPTPTPAARPPSGAGETRHYNGLPFPHTATTHSSGELDLDDLPLSQRRMIIRRSNLNLTPDPSLQNPIALPTPTAEAAAFDSHQPQRTSQINSAASEAIRQAKLANFRSSVAADLLASGALGAATARRSSNGRDFSSGATGNLQRNIELQRSILLTQKEAEGQRREQERLVRERMDREFDERMRRDGGALMEAHREAMRRLQRGAGST
ncbi:hypothetical protein MFIFM68171_10955 [Madurella fahalii]|uniref:TM7S3/TM198-like domain-containing protein n=1 Tax=Madurella fahalii TaxID=1157608 RepID=A0ABQ0GSM3_9PEZI